MAKLIFSTVVENSNRNLFAVYWLSKLKSGWNILRLSWNKHEGNLWKARLFFQTEP